MTIEELRAFLAAVEKHPELREELRRHVLTQELLAMPAELYRQAARLERVEEELAELREAVRALVTSSQHHEEELRALRAIAERHEQRLSDIDQRLDRLVAVTERHEERLSDIDQRLERLVVVTERHEEELRALRELAQKHDEELRALRELAQKHDEELRALRELAQKHDEELRSLRDLAQKHDEELGQLRKLAEKHDGDLGQIRSTVASLTTTVGAMVEADAVDALLNVLERKAIAVEELPTSIAVNGELDIAVPVVEPGGRRYWVVVEVKVQLHPRDIRAWLRKLHTQSFRERLAAAGIEPPFLAYVYGQRVYRPAIQRARELGVGILSRRGEYVSPPGLVE